MNHSVRCTATPEAAEEGGGRDEPRGRPERERKRLQRDQHRGEDARDHRPVGLEADREDASHDGADAPRGQDRGPGAGAPSRSSAIAGPSTTQPANVRLRIPKKTTDAQSHVRAVNSCQPSRSSAEEPGRRRLCTRRNPNATEDVRADEEAHGVERKCGTGLPRTTTMPPSCGPRTPTRFRESCPGARSPAGTASDERRSEGRGRPRRG